MAPRYSGIPERDNVKNIKSQDAYVDNNIQQSPDEITKAIKSKDAIVSGDIAVSQDDAANILKIKTHTVSSDIPAAEDTSKKTILGKPTVVSSDIPVSPDETKKNIKRPDASVGTDIQTSEDTQKKSILGKPTSVSNDIPSAPDEHKKHIKQADALVSTDITTANDEIKKSLKQPDPAVSADIPASPDEIRKSVKRADAIVGSDIPVSEDISRKNIIGQAKSVSAEIPASPDEIRKTVKKPDVFVNQEIQPAPDEIKKHVARPFSVVNNEINAAEDDIGKMPRYETPFIGRWVPSSDPLNIGMDNYSILQNMRYKNDGLEGVNGNSRINSTSVGAAFKNGIQFKTNYTTDSYVLLQRDNGTDAPDVIAHSGSIPGTGNFNSGTLKVTLGNATIYFKSSYNGGTDDSGWVPINVNYGTYGASTFATHLQTRMNASTDLTYGGGNPPGLGTTAVSFAVTYSSTTRKFTITAGDGDTPQIAYDDTLSTCDTEMGWSGDHALATAITTDTALSTSGVIGEEDASADLARMSLLPVGHVGICDQKNNYIWAGDEMPVAAFMVADRTESTPSSIQKIKDDFIVDYTKRANNNLTDSNNTIQFATINTSFGATTTRFDTTAGTQPDTITYTYDTNGTAPLFVTNGLATGYAMEILDGTAFDATNKDIMKIVGTVTETAFTVLNPIGTPENDKTLTVSDGMHCYGKYIVLGTTRRATAFNFVLETPNTTASTIEVYTWNGSALASCSVTDGTEAVTDDGKPFGDDGALTLTANITSAVPAYIGGKYLFWYFIALDEISATITSVTAKVTISDANENLWDLWDGIKRTPIMFAFVDDGVVKDYTMEVNKETYLTQTTGEDLYVAGIDLLVYQKDLVEVMFTEPTNAIILKLKDVSTGNSAILKVQYNDGNTWKDATIINDQTTAYYRMESYTGAPFINSGSIQWAKPTNESPITIRGITGYAYRFFNINPSANLLSAVAIDLCRGVSTYKEVLKAYKFPFMYMNRAMWCCSLSDKEENRVDYSKTNAPDVYNGMDASGQNNERSLYFGSYEPLTCAARLFNLYGDTLGEIALFFKYGETYMLAGNTPENFQIKQISDNIGCPAFRTLKTAEISFKPEGGGVEQNIAMWLSEQGPVMFRNNVLSPMLQDIEKYFDPSKDDYINKEYIGIAAAGFDTKNREYNLVIPTGDSTTNNVWLAFDLVRQKWYEKTGETDMPQGFIDVEDEYGNKYLYGYTDAGYLIRIEDPATMTWSDGETGITNVVQTADLLLTKSLWDDVLLYAHKVLFLDNDDGTITIDLYLDGNPAPERYTAATISFTTTDTISDSAGGFDTTVFKAGMPLFIEGSGISANNETFIIATVSATTITVTSDNAISNEDAGETITLKTVNLPYQKTMNEEDGFRYRNLISHLNKIGYSFKIRYTIEGCTSTKPKLLGHGLLWSPAREDLLDKDDWA